MNKKIIAENPFLRTTLIEKDNNSHKNMMVLYSFILFQLAIDGYHNNEPLMALPVALLATFMVKLALSTRTTYETINIKPFDIVGEPQERDTFFNDIWQMRLEIIDLHDRKIQLASTDEKNIEHKILKEDFKKIIKNLKYWRVLEQYAKHQPFLEQIDFMIEYALSKFNDSDAKEILDSSYESEPEIANFSRQLNEH